MSDTTKNAELDIIKNRSHRISIVDDDASVRRALDRLCKSAGYLVKLFESAEAFLEAAAAVETDCVILDVHLPGRSGLQLHTELQAKNKRLPVIFITAYDDEQTRAQSIQRGAIAFLRKPLDTQRLLDLIERALKENFVDDRTNENNEK